MHCVQSFDVYSPRKQREQNKMIRTENGKSFTPKAKFFSRTPLVLDAKTHLPGRFKSNRRAGDILGYSGNAAALRADATGDSMLFR